MFSMPSCQKIIFFEYFFKKMSSRKELIKDLEPELVIINNDGSITFMPFSALYPNSIICFNISETLNLDTDDESMPELSSCDIF